MYTYYIYITYDMCIHIPIKHVIHMRWLNAHKASHPEPNHVQVQYDPWNMPWNPIKYPIKYSVITYSDIPHLELDGWDIWWDICWKILHFFAALEAPGA